MQAKEEELKILVLGANGRTGRLVVEQALAAGHTVTAFVRDPSKLQLADERLGIASGDARDFDSLLSALRGCDAVINTIGGPERRLIGTTTAALVTAMQKSGVKRIVAMSTFLAAPNFKPTGMMRLFPRLARGVVKDDRAGAQLVEASGLDWTIVYATLLKSKPASGYRHVEADETVTGRNHVNRGDVAECLLAALDDRATFRRSLLITGR
ncbi:MAG: NAD(P)-dependent oxidoreductase [Gaiellaceae bacterium]